ncbi:MAG: cupin domain-containing protein, partial [Pseudomonadota bacterium]
MERLDRLSTLVAHLEVRLTSVDDGAPANLSVSDGALVWSTAASTDLPTGRRALVDLGPAAEPLRQALPARMVADLAEAPSLAALAALLTEELTTPRCGGRFALDRLGELVVVAMLRAEIERGETAPGPLAGLAHAGLSRAIVALHDAPGEDAYDCLTDLSGPGYSVPDLAPEYG